MDINDLKILGFKGEIDSVSETLDKVNSLISSDSIIQLLDADAICSKKHVIHGFNQAELAFKRGENLANDLSVEICLRCSAQRQISKAFNLLGLKEGNMNLCAVLINCDEENIAYLSSIFTHDDSVLAGDSLKLKELYSISDEEFDSMDIEDIIIDKITKLAVDY